MEKEEKIAEQIVSVLVSSVWAFKELLGFLMAVVMDRHEVIIMMIIRIPFLFHLIKFANFSQSGELESDISALSWKKKNSWSSSACFKELITLISNHVMSETQEWKKKSFSITRKKICST